MKKLSKVFAYLIFFGLVFLIGRCTLGWVFPSSSSLQEVSIPPRPQPFRLLSDLAGIFSDDQRNNMEAFLELFDSQTSNQIVVLTISSLGHYSIADFATGVGHSWGVGQSEFDNGVVIVLLPKTEDNDGEIFIATGYGLEAVLTDAICKRIVEQEMIPFFRTDNYYAGLMQALATIQQIAEGEISTDAYAYTPASEGSDEWTEDDWVALYIIVGIILFLIIVTALSNKNSGGAGTTLSGGRSSSSYSSSSWGGSSSGGSFGGGGFGGGGAGGRW
jgi:Beta-propeller domains of methanol dehydrogenase type